MQYRIYSNSATCRTIFQSPSTLSHYSRLSYYSRLSHYFSINGNIDFIPLKIHFLSHIMPEHECIMSISGRIHINPACIFQVVMAAVVVMDHNLLLCRKIPVFVLWILETHTQIVRHVALFEAVALFFRCPATLSH